MRTSIYDRISEKRIREEKRLEEERLKQAAMAPTPERFQTNELNFIRPTGFKDKTFHIFTLTDIGPSPLSVVIGRTVVAEGSDLEILAQELLADLKRALSHLEWIEHLAPAEAAGVQARRMEFKWRQQGQPVHQIQIVFLHLDELRQPLLMQVTGTSNNPKGMTPEEKSLFWALVASLELRPDPKADNTVAQV